MTSKMHQGHFLNITLDELWKLQTILSSTKGSLSQTYKKNTEANTKVNGLNQQTMQALNNLAIVYAAFEQSGANLEVESSEGRVCSTLKRVLLFQQYQECMQGELKDSQACLDSAFAES